MTCKCAHDFSFSVMLVLPRFGAFEPFDPEIFGRLVFHGDSIILK